MITLKGDNRQLVKNAKFSDLSINYASGINAIVVVNSAGFSVNDYILLGKFGRETTEIAQIASLDPSTHTLTLVSNTKFSHSESTRVTILPYNKIRFYHTTVATYGTSGPITDYIDIQPDGFFTRAIDSSNQTGFGWFVFYNSTTGALTGNSNAIPYNDFAAGSVKKIFDSFFSLLNNNEMKLISHEDAFRWLNEGYSIAKNELNLVNRNYNVTDQYPISIIAGTQEYSLPDDFSDLISVTNTNGETIHEISLRDVSHNNENVIGFHSGYFLRAGKIGFTPSPIQDTTYYMYYKTKTSTLNSYYDNVDLPDNNFFFLVDFMLYRVATKLPRFNGKDYFAAFRMGVDTMKMVSHKRSENQDSFGIADEANV